ncbi:outer membrane homotrimeric porin [Nitratidesulfovibrio termitidis]|uniref:outer membrane homotrimeric porin n=1 Tax=Nitratidesulfovibrio termitidis TaxID=42252 RepID=UPI0004161B08|nr:outer membrane homotrimeric porin [Nitratidesulfovibrio termitidis]
MKRIIMIVAVAMLLCGSAVGASAADIKAKGQWDFSFEWLDNPDFQSAENGGPNEDTFHAAQRLRTQIDVIASESLRGVIYFEIGDTVWGRNDGALGADGKSVEVKRSYIDWLVPDTTLKVRMGIQGLALPGAVAGSPVLDDDVAALTLSYQASDMVGVTVFWARPYDDQSGEAGNTRYDEADLFGIVVPVTLDGAKITPWGMYGAIGRDIAGNGANTASLNQAAYGLRPVNPNPSDVPTGSFGQETDAWWGGISFEVSMLSPWSFKLDAMYGNVESDDEGMDRSGWMVIGAVDYKMDMVTPGIFAWYATGDDDDETNGSERMPYIVPDFGPTSFGFDKVGAPINTDSLASVSGTGMWGIGVQFADISFMENLKHTVRIVYMTGTNDEDMVANAGLGSPVMAFNGLYMTDKDHAWEVNFDHFYKIYENLDLLVEMSYINADLDEDVWNNDFDDAWRLGFNLKYSF